MRMWMINPKMLCNRHLVGEHFEIHCMISNLRNGNGKWAKNLANAGYLEPQNADERHDELVEEMLRRRMNHKSPLDIIGIGLPIGKVDTDKSYNDLIKRCSKCDWLIIKYFQDKSINKGD